MPTLRSRAEQPSPVNPQVPVPNSFPAIPKDIIERFPSAADWQQRLDSFWLRTNQALQVAQQQSATQANSTVVWTVDRFLIYANDGSPLPMFALDNTGVRLGSVLVINTPGKRVYIGGGNYQNDDTPFYVDFLGRFSLGSSLAWDPETDTLTVVGDINATTGTIGGFVIGADYIRDAANSFGLSSTVTGADDVRFWAGDTFANRSIAPARIFESGAVVIANLTIGDSPLTGIPISVVATTQSGFGFNNNPLLVAPGNGQAMIGAYLAPRITKNGFTGLNAYCLWAGDATSTGGTGTLDNLYGVYIDNITIGVANWGLYVATTAKNYMAGALQIASLAGVGTRNVVADASGNLSAP